MYEASLACSEDLAIQAKEPYSLSENKFLVLNKLLRVAAWCQRFINNCTKVNINQTSCLTVEEITSAKKIWERYVQARYNPETVCKVTKGESNQLIRQLSLKFDENGIIQCHGRISKTEINDDAKWPKLLPRECPFTALVIQAVHRKVMHTGVAHTLSQIRYEYWIPQGWAAVRNITRKCMVCKKASGGPYQLPKMPDLPSARVNPSSSFTYAGLDNFGPLLLKADQDRKKIWVCIFTCLVVRAIHIEVVEDLSACQFLMCLRPFIARRGRPSEIICDNGPQFKVAKSATDKLWKSAICDAEVKNHMTSQGIKWKFVTELAPWMGGHHERLVGVTKQALKKSIGKLALTLNQLTTILAEVEAIVNSRPLTYVGDDFKDGNSLTPGHFLCRNPNTGIAVNPADKNDTDFSPSLNFPEKLVQDWRKGEAHRALFWQIWSTDYLLSLRESLATEHQDPKTCVKYEPRLAEIVLIKDPSARRGSWKLGKVQQMIRGSDGFVRSAGLILPGGKILKRSIGMLFPLECGSTDNKIRKRGTGAHKQKDSSPKVDTRAPKSKDSNARILSPHAAA